MLKNEVSCSAFHIASLSHVGIQVQVWNSVGPSPETYQDNGSILRSFSGTGKIARTGSITRTSMKVTRSPPQKQYETAERGRNAAVQAKRSSYSTFTVFEWKGGPSNIIKHCKAMPKWKPYDYDRCAKFPVHEI